MSEPIHASRRTYIVTFDASYALSGGEYIYNAIKTSSLFTSWWNWLPFVYLVESQAGADAICQELQRTLSGAHFLVAEVDLANSEGVLAQEAWNWVMRRQRRPEPQIPEIHGASLSK